MIGNKYYKKDGGYKPEVAKWCNSNNAMIVDKGEYYEVVEIIVTPEEIKQAKISELKQNLANTDYKAIQFAEGVITFQDYEPMKIQREEWREEIRKLIDKE